MVESVSCCAETDVNAALVKCFAAPNYCQRYIGSPLAYILWSNKQMRSMTRFFVASAAAAMLAVSNTANAQHQLGAIPTNATIVYGGLRWAWAFPLPGSSGAVTANQFDNYGWRLPTAAELVGAPKATDFLFSGANVPLDGSDPVSGAYFQVPDVSLTGSAACATPWFSSSYYHCDWQDGRGEIYGDWAGTPDAETFADQLYVQDVGPQSVVPEPSTYAMMGLGLLSLAAVRRRIRKS